MQYYYELTLRRAKIRETAAQRRVRQHQELLDHIDEYQRQALAEPDPRIASVQGLVAGLLRMVVRTRGIE